MHEIDTFAPKTLGWSDTDPLLKRVFWGANIDEIRIFVGHLR